MALAAALEALMRPLLEDLDGLDPAQIAPLLGTLEAAGYTIENVEFRRASLQDIFLQLVRP